MTKPITKRSTCDRCGSETGKPPRHVSMAIHCDPCIALRREERSAAHAWVGTCAVCRENFELRGQAAVAGRAGKRSTCSPACKSARSARVLAATNRKHASARMKERNPMRSAEARAKMAATLRRIGHEPFERGGNGRGMTAAQTALLAALGRGDGWTEEYVVPTRMGRRSGYPTHYKIDIALPRAMVAIEVDGASHSALARQEQDARKTDFLEARGWTVLRFTNAKVRDCLWTCVREARDAAVDGGFGCIAGGRT